MEIRIHYDARDRGSNPEYGVSILTSSGWLHYADICPIDIGDCAEFTPAIVARAADASEYAYRATTADNPLAVIEAATRAGFGPVMVL